MLLIHVVYKRLEMFFRSKKNKNIINIPFVCNKFEMRWTMVQPFFFRNDTETYQLTWDLFRFRFKDVIPKELRSYLVYKCLCSSSNATSYGKTERHLDVRSSEHIGLSPLTGNRVACKPSAIPDHLLLHEHNNSCFNNFSILCCKRI